MAPPAMMRWAGNKKRGLLSSFLLRSGFLRTETFTPVDFFPEITLNIHNIKNYRKYFNFCYINKIVQPPTTTTPRTENRKSCYAKIVVDGEKLLGDQKFGQRFFINYATCGCFLTLVQFFVFRQLPSIILVGVLSTENFFATLVICGFQRRMEEDFYHSCSKRSLALINYYFSSYRGLYFTSACVRGVLLIRYVVD